jgi:predicted RNase H-like HicB family nuclease
MQKFAARNITGRDTRTQCDLILAPPSGKPWLMKRFTAILHKGEPAEGGYWATCLEVPGANGQGETKAECLQSLREAIHLLLETEREEAFRLDPLAETEELILS